MNGEEHSDEKSLQVGRNDIIACFHLANIQYPISNIHDARQALMEKKKKRRKEQKSDCVCVLNGRIDVEVKASVERSDWEWDCVRDCKQVCQIGSSVRYGIGG